MRNVRTILILFIIALFAGCNVERDRADARIVAARVHSQMQAGDFLTIYREAAPRFKSVGSESQFVSQMQQYFQASGKLKKADEIAYQSGIDSNTGKMRILNFNVEYENGHVQERLSFIRSDNGQMQLWKLDLEPTD